MSRTGSPQRSPAPALAVASLALVLLGGPIAGCRTPPHLPPDSWGDIHSGIPREKLLRRLGNPSAKSPRGGDSWTANGWVLDVEYDEEGRVSGSSQGHAPGSKPAP